MDDSDRLAGGLGGDALYGGAGGDIFIYQSASDTLPAGRDTIGDFAAGSDRIDLQQIDADIGLAGDQAFSYIGSNAFTGRAGELRFGDGTLSGDVNGDGAADFQIDVLGVPSLGANDFLL